MTATLEKAVRAAGPLGQAPAIPAGGKAPADRLLPSNQTLSTASSCRSVVPQTDGL